MLFCLNKEDLMSTYLYLALLFGGALVGGWLSSKIFTQDLSPTQRRTAITAAILTGLFMFRMGIYSGEIIERRHVATAERQLAACRSERERIIVRARQVVLGAVNTLGSR